MGIPYPSVGGSFTLEELDAKARELHEASKAAPAANSEPAEAEKGADQ